LFLLCPALAYGQGGILPYIDQQFLDDNGNPVASGFICTTITGTTTNLATYPTQIDADAGTNANANPVVLDSAGRASIFLGTGVYRIVLLKRANQGSSSCNGTMTGSAIRTVDGVSGLGSLLARNNTWTGSNTFSGAVTISAGVSIVSKNIDNVRNCDAFSGATADLKIAACIADLPSTGGVADARGINGSQTWSSNALSGVTKNVDLMCGGATYTMSTTSTIPSSVRLMAGSGCQFSLTSGASLTIKGSMDGTDISKHFSGGLVTISSVKVPMVYPQWWGAVGDGSTNDYAAIQSAEDALISASGLNTIQGAPVGIVKFLPGTYYIGNNSISTCHFNSCPGGGPASIPAGTINACITLSGDDRGASVITTDQTVDAIKMYSWSCPSVVENLYIALTAGTGTGIRVRGNQTSLRRLWIIGYASIAIESTATIDTTLTDIDDVQCDANAQGGSNNCITITRSAGSLSSPNNILIQNVHCFGGNYCINSDHVWDSRISNVTGLGQNTYFISLSAATNVAISNITSVGTSTNSQNFEDGLEILSSSKVTVSNAVLHDFQGSALNIQSSTGVVVKGLIASNNNQTGLSSIPYDVYAINSDLTIDGGYITNTTGTPTNAIYFSGSGPAGSYVLSDLIITGSKYTGTTVTLVTGAGGAYRMVLTNNEFRSVNSTGGATPTVVIGAALSLHVANNRVTQGAAPTNWLTASFSGTTACFSGNYVDSGGISLNGTSYPNATAGCFVGGAQNGTFEAGALVSTGLVTGNAMRITGGTAGSGVNPSAGILALAFYTVAALPAAASNSGSVVMVSDSTAISAEGQTCVGMSSHTVLAFSDGANWRCF
jgi:hypothetical protein